MNWAYPMIWEEYKNLCNLYQKPIGLEIGNKIKLCNYLDQLLTD